MKKLILLAILASCGTQKVATVDFGGDKWTTSQELGECSSAPTGGIVCANGTQLPVPAAFPWVANCNKCITKSTVVGELVQIDAKCPNGMSWSFNFDKPKKGDKGDVGQRGSDGSSDKLTLENGYIVTRDGTTGLEKWKVLIPVAKDGKDGDIIERDGTFLVVYKSVNGVKATEKFRLDTKGLQGERGLQGDRGLAGKDGQGCSVSTNNIGQTVVTCGTTSTVLNSCGGGGGCWSYGLSGQVYLLPTNTQTLQDPALLGTPVAANTVDWLNEPSRDSHLGLWGSTTNGFNRTEWYEVAYGRNQLSFIEIGPDNVGPDGTVRFELISDDGAVFAIKNSNCVIEVVSDITLHAPRAKEGSFKAEGPGRFAFTYTWFQGPHVLIASKLSYWNYRTHRFEVVQKDAFTYQVK